MAQELQEAELANEQDIVHMPVHMTLSVHASTYMHMTYIKLGRLLARLQLQRRRWIVSRTVQDKTHKYSMHEYLHEGACEVDAGCNVHTGLDCLYASGT